MFTPPSIPYKSFCPPYTLTQINNFLFFKKSFSFFFFPSCNSNHIIEIPVTYKTYYFTADILFLFL